MLESTVLQPIDRMRALIDHHCKTGRYETPVSGLTLFRAEEPSSQFAAVYRPTLCLVLQGRKQVVLGDRIFTYDPNHYLLVTIDLPVTGCIVEARPERPYLGLTLALNPMRIADLVAAMPSNSQATDDGVAIATSRLGADLIDPFARLLQLLDRPGDADVIAPLIEREIYYRLLQGERGCVLRHVVTAGSHLSEIGNATDWIRTHYAEPISVERLAEQASMSVTSFHRHFKAITTFSPVQYRTQIRLQEARRLMLVNGQDASSIGFEVGYESPSQFNRDYRKMFGMPPAADAARLRHPLAANAAK